IAVFRNDSNIAAIVRRNAGAIDINRAGCLDVDIAAGPRVNSFGGVVAGELALGSYVHRTLPRYFNSAPAERGDLRRSHVKIAAERDLYVCARGRNGSQRRIEREIPRANPARDPQIEVVCAQPQRAGASYLHAGIGET